MLTFLSSLREERGEGLVEKIEAFHRLGYLLSLSNWVALRGFSRGLDSNLKLILGPNATKS